MRPIVYDTTVNICINCRNIPKLLFCPHSAFVCVFIILATNSDYFNNQGTLRRIWCYHSGGYGEFYLLGYEYNARVDFQRTTRRYIPHDITLQYALH
jgi:hypothetical protein